MCCFLSNETRRFSNFLIRNEDHKSGPILLKIALFALRRPCLRSAICARRSVPQVLPCKPSGGNGYMCIGLNAVFFKLFSAKCTPTSNKNRCFRNILTNTQNRPLCSHAVFSEHCFNKILKIFYKNWKFRNFSQTHRTVPCAHSINIFQNTL